MARGDIGINLGKIMDRVGMKPSELRTRARAIEVDLSHQRISNWRNGINDPTSDMLPVLAKLLKVKVDDLLATSLYDNQPIAPLKVRESVRAYGQTEVNVPRIQPVQAGETWTDPFGSDDEMPLPSFMVDALTFCCTVEGDSMANFLQHGDTAVFRQEHAPKIGRIILARNRDGGMTIKKLTHDGVNYKLTPLNPKYKAIEFAEWRIEGVLTGFVREDGDDTVVRHNPKGLRP
jgi:SOS-response transcriptional repressor LexA